MANKTRGIRIGRWGLQEDPTGLHILNPYREGSVLEVTGVRRDEGPVGGYFLLTRFFCGDEGPRVSAGAARVLPRRPA